MAEQPIVRPESNADRRRAKLEAKRLKNFRWMVNTSARATQIINAADDEIRSLGFEPEPFPFTPDYTNRGLLPTYVEQTQGAPSQA